MVPGVDYIPGITPFGGFFFSESLVIFWAWLRNQVFPCVMPPPG